MNRILDAEDIEMVEFSQTGDWDTPELLHEIADYAEETGRVPYAVSYTNDSDTQTFYAWFHL